MNLVKELFHWPTLRAVLPRCLHSDFLALLAKGIGFFFQRDTLHFGVPIVTGVR